MRPRVYIDGEVGTTGLRIRKWLAARSDLELLSIPEARRKDPDARRGRILASDATVLCLPDSAAHEVAGWLAGGRVRLIDASTAHRVADGWVYGLPELCPGQRETIAGATRISNPGCYASAFILLVRPLIDAGLLSPQVAPTIHALSGYSGGGRALIARWEDPRLGLGALPYEAPYALARVHKHIPEMMHFSGLRVEPQFLPAVGPFACGMRVQVALPASSRPAHAGAEALWNALHQRYAGEPFVRVLPLREPDEPNERAFDPCRCNDTNRIELHVLAHPSGHVVLMAILDNLGKGASGTAIQSLNLMLGLPESSGLPT
jgi:N-acetyl-gamma-glutamyl-phosphate reductase